MNILQQNNKEQIELNLIYLDMVNSLYTISDIRLYFLIKYQIDLSKPENHYILNKKRIGQEEFKQGLINRYGSKCMLTGFDSFDACHIIPFSDSNDMNIDNGFLFNQLHHQMFDDYKFSINPDTLQIEINYSKTDSEHFFIKMIEGIKLNQLEPYVGTLQYLKIHYTKFKMSL